MDVIKIVMTLMVAAAVAAVVLVAAVGDVQGFSKFSDKQTRSAECDIKSITGDGCEGSQSGTDSGSGTGAGSGGQTRPPPQ